MTLVFERTVNHCEVIQFIDFELKNRKKTYLFFKSFLKFQVPFEFDFVEFGKKLVLYYITITYF